jgi:hypothetical protein
MDVGTGSLEYNADSESSQRSAMTHPLGAARHQSSYMQQETPSNEIAEESVTTSGCSSGTQVGNYNQNDITDDEASDKSTHASTISKDSEYFTAFSELSNYTEVTRDETAEDGEIESMGHRHSTRSDISDENLGTDMGSVGGSTSSSTVTDFLEGCLDILDEENGNSQNFNHSQTWAFVHNNVPIVNDALRDQNNGVIQEISLSHEMTPASISTCSQAECDFIANLLIPTPSEEAVYTPRATHGHPAWSQPVGLPYVKPLHALDIDVLSDPQKGIPQLVPTRPPTPIGGSKDKEKSSGDSPQMISDLSTHIVAAELTMRHPDSSLYSLFGNSPPPS